MKGEFQLKTLKYTHIRQIITQNANLRNYHHTSPYKQNIKLIKRINLHEEQHNTPKSTKFTIKHARKPITQQIAHRRANIYTEKDKR